MNKEINLLPETPKEKIERAMVAEELLKEGYKIAEPFRKYPLK